LKKNILIYPLLAVGFLVFLFEVLLVSSCAQVRPVTGGERDTIAPRLDTLNSTPNFQTNFEKQDIKLVFSEFLQLKDIGTQIVISPPLLKPWKASLNKYRNVIFEFDEEEKLKEDVTYTINFGEAIQDFTESNPTDYSFVFSTGAYIDSLQVRGRVTDAYTSEPIKDVLFMLYENLADTSALTSRPFYFGRTNENGDVVINNVKADTFKVFVLQDSDINYRYNQESEGIGYLDTFIMVNDSFDQRIDIQFSQPRIGLKLQKETQEQFGKVQLDFNRKPFDVVITKDEISQRYWQETVKDSIFVWYDYSSGDPWNMYVQIDTLIDTIAIETLSKEELKNTQTLEVVNILAGRERAYPHNLALFDTNIRRYIAHSC